MKETHVPPDAPYVLKHPICRRTFNIAAYDADVQGPEALFNDIEQIIRFALTKLKPKINPNHLGVRLLGCCHMADDRGC